MIHVIQPHAGLIASGEVMGQKSDDWENYQAEIFYDFVRLGSPNAGVTHESETKKEKRQKKKKPITGAVKIQYFLVGRVEPTTLGHPLARDVAFQEEHLREENHVQGKTQNYREQNQSWNCVDAKMNVWFEIKGKRDQIGQCDGEAEDGDEGRDDEDDSECVFLQDEDRVGDELRQHFQSNFDELGQAEPPPKSTRFCVVLEIGEALKSEKQENGAT